MRDRFRLPSSLLKTLSLILLMLLCAIPIIRSARGDHPWNQLNQEADAAYQRKDYAGAASLWLRATNSFPIDSPDAVSLLLTFAGKFLDAGDAADAERFYTAAIRRGTQGLGQTHPKTTEAVCALADLCEAHGRYSEAQSLFREAIDARQNVVQKNWYDAYALEQEADLYVHQRRFVEAESLYVGALSIFNQILPDRSAEGTLLTIIADTQIAQGKYEQAEKMCKQALGIKTKLSNDELELLSSQGRPFMHKQTVAAAISNLADIYVVQRRYSEAQVLYPAAERLCEDSERELALRKDRPGPEILQITDFYIPTAASIRQKLFSLRLVTMRSDREQKNM